MKVEEEGFILSLNRWRKAVAHLAEMEDELLEQGIVPFTARITKGNRLTVPFDVMKKLSLEVNDWVFIPLSKTSRTEIPPKKRRKSKPTDEPELIDEEPMVEHEEEQEYIEPCPNGLDRPLQDLKVCRGGKCEHYKRKWGSFPEACNWKKWRKIGWEDEVKEEPVEDAPVEELVAEPELEEPVEVTEDEDEIVMLHCDSGVHEPGPVPHRKKVQRRGWAMYTCTICNKETPWLISKAEKVEGEVRSEAS